MVSLRPPVAAVSSSSRRVVLLSHLHELKPTLGSLVTRRALGRDPNLTSSGDLARLWHESHASVRPRVTLKHDRFLARALFVCAVSHTLPDAHFSTVLLAQCQASGMRL